MTMQSIRSLILILFIGLSYSPLSFALNLQASVSKNKVAQNEVFQLRIVADERLSSDDINFDVLDQDFYLSRPSFGSSINSINGKRTTRSEWNISLASNKLGMVKIPSFEVNGAQTQPIAIQVVKAQDAVDPSELIDLNVSLDNQQLYPNESSILSIQLVVKSSASRLRNPRIFPPKIDGLSMESVDNGNQYNTVIDGVSASVVEYQFRLTADKPGTYQLQGPRFTANLMDDDPRSGSTRLVPVDIRGKNFTMTVEGKPSNYSGVWLPTPQLTLDQNWQDSNNNAVDVRYDQPYSTQVGESLSREITLDIQGLNPERFPDLKIDYPNSVRVYSEKPQFEKLDNNTTRMTLKQVLIPQAPGAVTLPGLALNWWDSQEREQRSASLNALTLDVASATSINAAPVAPSLPSVDNPVETVTIKDAGWWPTLSAILAVLWLVTSAIAFRLGRQRGTKAPNKTEIDVDNHWNQLLYACQRNDVIQIQHYCSLWLQDHPELLSQYRAEIEQQLSEMNQSQFSESDKVWQSRHLVSVLKKARKSLKKETAKDVTLAKL